MEEIIDRQAISTRLKQLVNESGMTSKEFSILMDIAQPTLSQILTGKSLINLDTINKVVAHGGALKNFEATWFLFGNSINCPTALSDGGLFPMEAAGSMSVAIEQAEEIGRLKQCLKESKPKEIERIVVFYTDNSVATYILQE